MVRRSPSLSANFRACPPRLTARLRRRDLRLLALPHFRILDLARRLRQLDEPVEGLHEADLACRRVLRGPLLHSRVSSSQERLGLGVLNVSRWIGVLPVKSS
jgi:hypothetical protein